MAKKPLKNKDGKDVKIEQKQDEKKGDFIRRLGKTVCGETFELPRVC